MVAQRSLLAAGTECASVALIDAGRSLSCRRGNRFSTMRTFIRVIARCANSVGARSSLVRWSLPSPARRSFASQNRKCSSWYERPRSVSSASFPTADISSSSDRSSNLAMDLLRLFYCGPRSQADLRAPEESLELAPLIRLERCDMLDQILPET